MAHNIYQLDNGLYSMAFTGETPWHKLGQQIKDGAPIEVWAKQAGLDWTIQQSTVSFMADINGEIALNDFDGQRVLYRSDNGQPLSIVSNRYQIVQPAAILDFFREFAEAGDMKIETAGSLVNGSKIWCLARLSDGFNVSNQKNDVIRPYVLLATSCDKSLPTIGKLTSVRVVCNNTLDLSIGEGSSAVRVPHSTKFDAAQVKADMGLVRESIQTHAEKMRKMQKLTLTDEQAMAFFVELLKTPEEKASGTFDADKNRRSIPKLWSSYKSAPGAEDTLWGAVNAVTHSIDFNPHARSVDTRLNSAWFGQGANFKTSAYKLASDDSYLEKLAA